MVGVTIIVVYLLSCYGTYKFIQHAYYSEDGIHYGETPDLEAVCLMFFPLLNSFAALVYIAESGLVERIIIKVFKPKK